MPKIRYTIEEVFKLEQEGILARDNTKKFFIPPYQRGYKWDNQVDVLLNDFHEAYEYKLPDYYLQNIVAKKTTKNDDNVLELIDGQQRITTLSILFAVFHHINNDLENFSSNKLIYGIREKVNSFFNNFVYNDLTGLLDKKWETIIAEDEKLNEQDIYYLFNAIKKIHIYLSDFEKDKLIDFYEYIKNKVLIIYHPVDESISSEKIFGNLNSNKLELTDIELVKALLLTKTGREIHGKNSTFKELIDKRILLGRQWDEINIWLNKKEVKSFLFKSSENSPLSNFLKLIAENDTEFSTNTKYPLFTFFDKKIKNKSDKANAITIFNQIKLNYLILKEWFNDNNIFNLLSFIMYAENENIDAYYDFFTVDKSELKGKLLERAIEILPSEEEINNLDYDNSKDRSVIRITLLALSIFVDDKTYRYNFYKHEEEKWSLEHIFPQNPKNLSNKLLSNDIVFVKEIFKHDNTKIDFNQLANEDETADKVETIYNKLKDSLNNKDSFSLSTREKELLYKFIKIDKLHSIGNLALLTSSDNSANSNGMFNEKRHKIVNRISNGSFVPKHTYDVFSKLIIKNGNNINIWSEEDIVAHTEWIKLRISNLKN